MAFPTLLRPPPTDPNRSLIENELEVTEMQALGPNIFTNARRMWQPPGARGIYGGTVVAMCLAAGQRTVAADFALHSCHCYFLLAGNSELPLLFHVELVRDGRSYATRTVQARQRGRCIFTVTMSFVKAPRAATDSSVPGFVSHAVAMPAARPPIPPDDYDDTQSIESRISRALHSLATGQGDSDGALRQASFADEAKVDTGEAKEAGEAKKDTGEAKEAGEAREGDDDEDNMFPLQSVQSSSIVMVQRDQDRFLGTGLPPPPVSLDWPAPPLKKTQQWVRLRGPISAAGGRVAHLTALAYLTDRFFIGTICRIHGIWRFPFPVEEILAAEPGAGRADASAGFVRDNPHLARLLRDFVEFESGGIPLQAYRGRPSLGMLVSLDHTIHFHAPDAVRADEWMLAEMESPWADAGRGVVTQRIFNKDGVLLATCVQEGILRLRKEDTTATPKL